jgi:hypothetical protein
MFSWLLFNWFITFGLVPQQEFMMDDTFKEAETISTVVSIGFDATVFDKLTVYGTLDNFQYARTPISYRPYQIRYKIGAAYSICPWLSVNIMHECDHEIVFNELDRFKYGKQETSIYLKISGSFGGNTDSSK